MKAISSEQRSLIGIGRQLTYCMYSRVALPLSIAAVRHLGVNESRACAEVLWRPANVVIDVPIYALIS